MKILLISYINRSGSTLLANMLSKNASICVCPEADILYNLFLENALLPLSNPKLHKKLKLLSRDKKFLQWNLLPEDILIQGNTNFEAFTSILLSFQKKHFRNCTLIVFKHNALYKLNSVIVPENIETMFWLNLLRNPLAIYASQKKTISPSTNRAMTDNPLSLIDQWNHFVRHCSHINNKRVKTILYEDFVKNYTRVLPDIFEWLKITKDQTSVKNLYKWISDEYKLIHQQVNNLPNTNSLNKWEAELTAYERWLLTHKMTTTEYYPKPGYFSPRFAYLYLLLKRISRKIHLLRSWLRQFKTSLIPL